MQKVLGQEEHYMSRKRAKVKEIGAWKVDAHQTGKPSGSGGRGLRKWVLAGLLDWEDGSVGKGVCCQS